MSCYGIYYEYVTARDLLILSHADRDSVFQFNPLGRDTSRMLNLKSIPRKLLLHGAQLILVLVGLLLF